MNSVRPLVIAVSLILSGQMASAQDMRHQQSRISSLSKGGPRRRAPVPCFLS